MSSIPPDSGTPATDSGNGAQCAPDTLTIAGLGTASINANSSPEATATTGSAALNTGGATLDLQLSEGGIPTSAVLRTNNPPAAGRSYDIASVAGSAANSATLGFVSGSGSGQSVCVGDEGTVTVNQINVTYGGTQSNGTITPGSVASAVVTFSGVHCGSGSSADWAGQTASGCVNVQNAGTMLAGQ